jgi:Protein of unknown function (DUF3261)
VIRSGSAALGLVLLLLETGCASLGLGIARLLPDGARECAGRLPPSQQLEGDFRVRQRARVQGESLDWRLELVAEKRGDALVLLGLDAFGGKLFAVSQQGAEVEVERPRGRLPRPPVDLLRDFHRSRPASEAAPPEPGIRIERAQPGEVSIEHDRCGYRTRLVTLEETPLPLRGEDGH